MPFVPLVAMGAVVFTIVNFLKNLKAMYWSPVITQVIAWVSGWVTVLLFAATDWADKINFGDSALSQLNGSSQLVIGLQASSLFGVVTQAIKAIDRKDSAVTPPLIPDATSPVL